MSIEMDKTNVVFLLPGVDHGPVGGYKVVYEYANRLVYDGWSVTLVYPIVPYIFNFWKDLVNHPRSFIQGVYRLILEGWRNRNKEIKWFKIDQRVKQKYYFYLWKRLPASFEKRTRFVATYFWTAICLNKMRCQCEDKFYLIQDREDWYGFSEKQLKRTYRFQMTKIAISEWLRDYVQTTGETCAFIPNGLDFDYFKMTVPIETRNKYSVAMLWNADERKRMDVAIDALKIVRENFPQLCVCAFGSTKRPDSLPEWIAYVQRPDRDCHNGIYNHAAIFIATSDQEGWGLTPCEAMICGAAVACTDIGGYRSFAKDGVTALMSSPGDAELLARNICRLISDDNLRIQIAKAGHENIKRFSWGRSLGKIEKLLNGSQRRVMYER